jgi:hypothetical protein
VLLSGCSPTEALAGMPVKQLEMQQFRSRWRVPQDGKIKVGAADDYLETRHIDRLENGSTFKIVPVYRSWRAGGPRSQHTTILVDTIA